MASIEEIAGPDAAGPQRDRAARTGGCRADIIAERNLPLSPHRRRLLVVATFAAAQGLIAAATYAGFVLADRCRDDWAPLRSMDRLLMFADVPGYFNNACRAFQGRVPYRDDPIEYPVLALPFLYLPRFFTGRREVFIAAFAAEMLLINAVTLGLVAWWVARQDGEGRVAPRLAWSTAFFVAIGPFVVGRFDAVPAAFAFAAATCWFSGRPAVGGALAGLGTLVKVVPGAVALPGLLWELAGPRNGRGMGMAAFAITLAAGSALWFAMGGAAVLISVRYHTDRGLELGSVYSGALRLLAAIRGVDVWSYHANVSENLGSPWSGAVAKLTFPVQALALVTVAGRAWRVRVRDPMRWAAASVVAFAVLGKVLSPQYLVWIAPFVAALGGPVGRRARPIFLMACLANLIIYPWGYQAFIRLDLAMFLVLNLRNALLLTLLGLLLFGSEAPEAEPSGRVASYQPERAPANVPLT